MNSFLRFLTTGLLLWLLTSSLSAQVVTKYVAIANGGQFGNPAENAHLLLFNPADGSVFSPDTVQTQSAQDLLVERQYAYLAAQDSIVKYDLSSGQRIAAEAFGAPSTIRLGLYQDYLLAGNWYGASTGNFRVFDKYSLAFVDTVAGISKGATDFVVLGDTAYVAQNFTTSAFVDSAGYLAVVDLRTLTHVRDIHFSNNGEDLGRLVLLDSVIYGLNPASNSITAYEVNTATSVTLPAGVDIQVRTNGPQTAWKGNALFFPFNNGIGSWDLAGFAVIDSQVLDTVATGMALDTLSNRFYLTLTDFFSFTQGAIWDMAGNKLGNLPVGSAPEAVQVVYNTFPEARSDTFVHAGPDSLYLPVLANDRDGDGDSLEIRIVTPPHTGQASVAGNEILLVQGGGLDSLQYAAVDPWGDADSVWVQLWPATGIEDLQNASWSVYPNPCKDHVWMEVQSDWKAVTFRLTDLSGRELKVKTTRGGAPMLLDMEDLPAGAYLLQVLTEAGRGWKKIIKK